MAYQALYRKFRPQEFEDVKGQEHIVTTLQNQIKADRIGHAYLFCGTRGTGKTTVAKIFARAVNCENPVDGSPCGVCRTCRSIAAGTSMNVIEIDAASNNGVDNIRQIREEVSYRPAEGKYKVYIIDEVHMLSTGAFNALLKTLEEPPAYVIFILATTEAHKIPVTILSRCQRYDFHRITIDTIADRLRELMDREEIQVEDRALRYLAKAGDGSMRDALSLLDQCIAFHIGEKLTYENVLEVLGAADTEAFSALLRRVIDRDVKGAVDCLESMINEGREIGQLVSDLTWYMRDLLLMQSADHMEEVLDMSAENLQALKEEAGMVSPQVLMRYIRLFSELSSQLRFSSQKRVLLEVALIRLCRPQMEEDLGSLTDRMEIVERKLEQGTFSSGPAEARHEAGPELKTELPVMPKAIPEDIKKVIGSWNRILSELGGLTRIYLGKAVPTLGSGGELLLYFDDEDAYAYISGVKGTGTSDAAKTKGTCLERVRQAVEKMAGGSVEIEVRKNTQAGRAKDLVPDLRELVDMPIETEDF